jgi:hypothetical protein
MFNVFYRDSHLQGRMSGPKKVIENLFRSLDEVGVLYSENKEEYENNLFLHWDPYQVNNYANLKNKEKLLVGPQVWPFAPEFSQLTEYGKIITPSQWVADLYTKFFKVRGTLNWPVAIYPPEISNDITTDCLIYYKNRPVDHLQAVLDFFEKRGITYTGLEYGNYTQEEFIESLSSVRFCVIIDNTESQGIATQEMMAANKPIFVWDQTIWDHMGSEYTVPATSVPYWSEECGIIITSQNELENSFDIFYSNLSNYSPRDFVERELSAQKTVQILLEHYES